MRFGLTTWIGDGTEGNEYRPAGVDGSRWAVIDLRPDVTVAEGFCLYAVEGDGPRAGRDFGDDPNGRLPGALQRAFGNDLKVDLSDAALRGLIAELLIVHGTAPHDRTRWNRLKENRRGRHRIVMLGHTLYDAPIIRGTTITESFNKADAATLGPDLTWTEVEGEFSVVSNRAESQSTTAGTIHAAARAEHDLAGDDHYAQADCTWVSTNVGIVGTAVRFASGATTYYRGGWHSFANDDRLHRSVAGSLTQLATQDHNLTVGTYFVYTEIDGSALETIVNSDTPLSTTDTNITGNLRTGIVYVATSSTSAADAKHDNFEAGDLGAGTPATVTPAVVGLTAAVPTPTPSIPAVVTPAVVAAGVNVPAISVIADAVVTPGVIPLVTTFPTPATGGGSVATPDVIAVDLDLPTVSALAGAVVTPDVVTTIVDLAAPSVLAGAAVTPDVIPLTLTVPTPTAGPVTAIVAPPLVRPVASQARRVRTINRG